MSRNPIIEKINKFAAFLSEEDINGWVIMELLDFFKSKINYFASQIYGANNIIAPKSFTIIASEALKNALKTFLLEKEYWKDGRDIAPYLYSVLNKTYFVEKKAIEGSKTYTALMCPACRFLKKREFLLPHGKLWKCDTCSALLENEFDISRTRYLLYKAFAVHSRHGWRCPHCYNFIPQSLETKYGVSCPYPGCYFYGTTDKLQVISHPAGQTKRIQYSLTAADRDASNFGRQGDIPSNEISTDSYLEVNEKIFYELDVLKEVIREQIKYIENNSTVGTLMQKKLMYEAFQIMLEKYPHEMVRYLAHQKYIKEFPIMARIFQEYCKLVQNNLPCTLYKIGKSYEITSLADPVLYLFDGISEFDAFVGLEGLIPNKTKEIYVGGRSFINYGPCFIGMLLGVSVEGKSILSNVIEYGFNSIKVDGTIPVGTQVHIKHYRIPSHYEIGSLIFLQRIRKRIVASVLAKLKKW